MARETVWGARSPEVTEKNAEAQSTGKGEDATLYYGTTAVIARSAANAGSTGFHNFDSKCHGAPTGFSNAFLCFFFASNASSFFFFSVTLTTLLINNGSLVIYDLCSLTL